MKRARRTRTTRPRGQQGAALLMAMLVVALVATLAAGALWQQWRGVEVEAAERSRVQSAWLLTGALDWSRLILRQDALAAPEVDHLAEPWALPLAESRLSTFLAGTPGAAGGDTDREAFLSGHISDAQGRLNVGNLVFNGQLQSDWLTRFSRLFQLLGLPQGELDRLAQGMLAALPPTGTQAAEGAPLPPQRVDELAWLGLSPATVEALRPYVVVILSPTALRVNLNTASAEVIYAAGVEPARDEQPPVELDLASARALVDLRARSHIRDLEVARMALGTRGAALTATAFDLRSRYFEVRGRLRLDDLALEELSLLRRDGNNGRDVTTLWRQRTTLSTQAEGGMDFGAMQEALKSGR